MTRTTDDLIEGLAGGLVAIPAGTLERRIRMAAAGGALIVLILVTALLGLRPDLGKASLDAELWIKLIYTGGIAALALAAARRLARPDVSGTKVAVLAVPITVLALLAIFELGTAPAGTRSALIFGETWQVCSMWIAGLALPLLAVLLRVFSGFAPQRPRLTGGVVGLFAGAATATLYSLHCPEAAMTFVLLWYSAGIAVVAALGAIVGPRVLRW